MGEGIAPGKREPTSMYGQPLLEGNQVFGGMFLTLGKKNPSLRYFETSYRSLIRKALSLKILK